MPEELGSWNADRHRELNDYFRIRIRVMLESDPYLKELVEKRKGLQLAELTDRMSFRDQQLWEEFLQLDALKFHRDMQDHLEGRGTPYNSRTGFGNNTSAENDEPAGW